ncbi:MAG: cytochrome b/b6 domain-containing protein [Gallionella sp.]|nr:cytochrome b/b6 domain-containing protein [Gallionella sp.]
MTHYSKRVVIAHWLTLLLLVAAYVLGEEAHDARKAVEGAGATIAEYVAHSLAGAAVLLLTILRLFFRKADGVPAPIGTGLMDKVATGVHHALYLVLFLLPVSGMMIVLNSSIGKAILAGDPTLLPRKFSEVPAHDAHEILVTVLFVLVGIHVLGAIKHQFLMKDGLISRMWFK